jgi:hypothetical protein
MESRKVLPDQAEMALQPMLERALRSMPEVVQQLAQQWEAICIDQTENTSTPNWKHIQDTLQGYANYLLQAGVEEITVIRCEARPTQITADANCHHMAERRRRENVSLSNCNSRSSRHRGSSVDKKKKIAARNGQVRSAQIQAKVLVNDQELAVLPWEQMRWPSFDVDFLQKVPVR